MGRKRGFGGSLSPFAGGGGRNHGAPGEFGLKKSQFGQIGENWGELGKNWGKFGRGKGRSKEIWGDSGSKSPNLGKNGVKRGGLGKITEIWGELGGIGENWGKFGVKIRGDEGKLEKFGEN